MKRFLPTAVLGIAAASLGLSVAFAQGTTPPAAPAQANFAVPPYKNLKVIGHDISRADLLNTMKSFSQSLGVRCTHCHVGEEGKPLSTFDFASDAKEKKLIARKMLTMVHRINDDDLGLFESDPPKVTCFTCHRGSVKPLTLPPDAAVPPAPPAAPQAPKSERG
ncbi:MAG TPA: c-type cytochrome [Sphingomicrobium sp.]